MTSLEKTTLNAWAKKKSDLLNSFETNEELGLSTQVAVQRLSQYGPNSIRTSKKKSLWDILLNQLKSVIVALLLVSGVVSLFFGDWIEALSIFLVLIINAMIGFLTEKKAVRSMEALKELGHTETVVIRDGKIESISAENLIPGDIVQFDAGDVVTADIRLVESSNLSADESALTGESMPVEKNCDVIAENSLISDRTNMLHKGTFIVRGSAKGLVTGTGMNTELGGIAELTDSAQETQTPLEVRLDRLGRRLVWVSLIIALFIVGLGVMSGKELSVMIETAIALAVAAIPEGLPIVATMALARGMWEMAKKNALINRLSAVETLGATTTIFTDKTGTLTKNQMSVEAFAVENQLIENANHFSDNEEILAHRPLISEILTAGALCTNAAIGKEGSFIGDPMEVALLQAAADLGISLETLNERFKEVKEFAFDPTTRVMATLHRADDHFIVFVKGAPEAVLNCCDHYSSDQTLPLDDQKKESIIRQNAELAAKGYRVLAMAKKRVNTDAEAPYAHLVWLGMVGMIDPPREGVSQAITRCHEAGIKTVMLTGDQGGTALNVAKQVGLVGKTHERVIHGSEIGERDEWSEALKSRMQSEAIYCRVSPKQKLALIEHHQELGQVVAMTGDGVNDAPALKRADIGIAMGKRGTQVAREASDMVITDDHFDTIVFAIQRGRIVFSNIRRFVLYLLSCNVSEVLIVGIASFVNAPLPLLPLQILFLNLVTDVFPALALGMGEGDESYLREPPRASSESILENRHWGFIIFFGLLITFSVLSGYFLALNGYNFTREEALSISFLTLGFAQVFHVFNMRLLKSSVLKNDVVNNPYVWGAIGICTGLLGMAILLAPLRNLFHLALPSKEGWAMIAIGSLFPLVVGQIGISILSLRSKKFSTK